MSFDGAQIPALAGASHFLPEQPNNLCWGPLQAVRTPASPGGAGGQDGARVFMRGASRKREPPLMLCDIQVSQLADVIQQLVNFGDHC